MRYLYLLMLIMILSCKSEPKSEQSQDASPPDIMQVSDSEAHKTTLTYSDDWSHEEDATSGVDFFLMYDKNDDDFHENINQVSLQLDESIGLNEFLRLNLEDLKANFPDLKTRSSERINVNGNDAQLIEYETDYEGATIYYLQQYMIQDNVAYVLTFSGDKEDGQRLRSEVIEIFHSFRP